MWLISGKVGLEIWVSPGLSAPSSLQAALKSQISKRLDISLR